MSSTAVIRSERERGEAALFQIAARLAGQRVLQVEPVAGGGNNRLHRLICADGTVLALKSYLRDPSDSRDRLGAEYGAARFLWDHGVRSIPRPIAVDAEDGHALYAWIEGERVTSIQAEDIDGAARFLGPLQQLTTEPAAQSLPLAAEACLSASDLLGQIERRFVRLAEVAEDHPDLRRLLREEMGPALMHHRAAAMAGYAAAGKDFAAPLEPHLRTLSPSDFGFHNALRQASGELVFLDFEYFGWDDPVKLVSDFLWHPAMALTPALAKRFRARMLRLFGDEPWFVERLAALHPLYGLRWTAIILNEFLPERWRRRAYAGTVQREAALERQLAKAHTLLSRLAAGQGGKV